MAEMTVDRVPLFEEEAAEPRARESRATLSFPARSALAVAVLCAMAAGCALAVLQGGFSTGAGRGHTPLRELSEEASQLIYIVRHGDKYSSYPACKKGQSPVDGDMCFDKNAMGVNPPLTECGVKQAKFTTSWIVKQSGGRTISNVVASPYTRTLQTALPLVKHLNTTIKVEYLLSEARQPEGPFRPFNVEVPAFVVDQLKEIESKWDPDYGSPPIQTPEDTPLYDERVAKMAQTLKQRFPPSSGDLAVFTHATTSFSVAYGLCSELFASLQDFVDPQKAIAPAGVIVATLDREGKCTKVAETQNVAEEVGCGETEPYKCEFKDYPNWYWEEPKGSGPEKCH